MKLVLKGSKTMQGEKKGTSSVLEEELTLQWANLAIEIGSDEDEKWVFVEVVAVAFRPCIWVEYNPIFSHVRNSI